MGPSCKVRNTVVATSKRDGNEDEDEDPLSIDSSF